MLFLKILKCIPACFVLPPTEVEECPQSEGAPATEPERLVAEQLLQASRSSSTPEVSEPLCSDCPPGTYKQLQFLTWDCDSDRKQAAHRISFYIHSNATCIYFEGVFFVSWLQGFISGNEIFSLFICMVYMCVVFSSVACLGNRKVQRNWSGQEAENVTPRGQEEQQVR